MKLKLTAAQRKAGVDLRDVIGGNRWNLDQLSTPGAVNWCRHMNAGVRFESDGTVSVWANGKRRRRPTFKEAVIATQTALEADY